MSLLTNHSGKFSPFFFHSLCFFFGFVWALENITIQGKGHPNCFQLQSSMPLNVYEVFLKSSDSLSKRIFSLFISSGPNKIYHNIVECLPKNSWLTIIPLLFRMKWNSPWVDSTLCLSLSVSLSYQQLSILHPRSRLRIRWCVRFLFSLPVFVSLDASHFFLEINFRGFQQRVVYLNILPRVCLWEKWG